MTTATMTGLEELQAAERRLRELNAEQQTAEAALRQLRTDLANGIADVAAVTESEARVNALRGTVGDLNGTLQRLRAEHTAEAGRMHLQAQVDAYRESGRAVSARIREFARLAEELRAAAIELDAAETAHGVRGEKLVNLRALPKNLRGEEVPEATWREFGGALTFYRAMLPQLRSLNVAPMRR